ncbi:hypothetical protein, partial [Pseudomonas avellanae]
AYFRPSQKKSTPERREEVLIAKTTGEPDVPNNVRDLSSTLEVPESGRRNAIVGEKALNAISNAKLNTCSIHSTKIPPCLIAITSAAFNDVTPNLWRMLLV